MRRMWVGLLVLGLAAPPGGAEPTPPGPPRSIPEALARLEAAGAALDRLVERANRDPAFRFVEAYNAYTADQFEQRDRVTAKDLAEILSDEDKQFDVRKAAQEALMSERAMRYDPDLAAQARRGSRRPRREFGSRVLAPLVKDSDTRTVMLANEILVKYFGRQPHQALRTFRPESATRAEKREASEAWSKILRD
jgi:hypothetical protein